MWEKNSGRKQGISRFLFFLGGVALGGVPQDSHDLRCSKQSPPKHPHYHISNVGCVWSFQKTYTLRSTNIAIEKCTIFMVISRKIDFPMALYQFTRGYQTNSSNLPWHPSMIPIFVSSSEKNHLGIPPKAGRSWELTAASPEYPPVPQEGHGPLIGSFLPWIYGGSVILHPAGWLVMEKLR